MQHRNLIVKAFNRYGLKTIRPDALRFLEEIIDEHDLQDEHEISSGIDSFAREYLNQEDTTAFVSRDVLERIYQDLQSGKVPRRKRGRDEDKDTEDADIDIEDHLCFVSAFEMPWWRWSDSSMTFTKETRKPGIAGTADSRARLYRDRLHVIRQTVLRNEHFAPAAFRSRDKEAPLRLRSTKDLLGRANNVDSFLLLGVLAHTPEGKLCLEDLDGSVVLDVSDTEPSEGLYTEGCIALVEGTYTDDETLLLHAIGHPPTEKRDAARKVFGHIDFLGKHPTTLMEDLKFQARLAPPLPTPSNDNNQSPPPPTPLQQTMFFVFSDVWLDRPETLPGLSRIFANCEEANFIPKVIVLCGNFTSQSVPPNAKGLQKYQDGFDALAETISQYPLIHSTTHFVLVPGPLDITGSAILPRRPILSSFTSKLRSRLDPQRLHLLSNPARIKCCGQELVIFRDDVMSRMLRNLIMMKEGADSDELKRFLVQTVVDQGHLSPLPHSTLAEFDHSMRLYPVPTALILADKYERYDLTYEGCQVFNPGRFLGSTYGFSTYYLGSRKSEISELPLDEMV